MSVILQIQAKPTPALYHKSGAAPLDPDLMLTADGDVELNADGDRILYE